MTSNAAGKGELFEEAQQTFFILALLRIDLRIRALEVHRPQDSRRTMPRPGHVDHVEIKFCF